MGKWCAVAAGFLWFAGGAVSEEIQGFTVGQEYVCAVEHSTYMVLENGSSGEWNNAPSSLRLRIDPCNPKFGACSMMQPSPDLFELTIATRKEGQIKEHAFLLHRDAYAFGTLGMVDLKGGSLFWTKQEFVEGGEKLAAFSLVAGCFQTD